MTWPQAAHLGDAMFDIWDAKLIARILQWDYHQTIHDPKHLFELNFFHPAHDVLAFSENLWGVSLIGWPLLALGASPLVNFNVLLLAGIFLSALSAWALARYVTGDPHASAVAGLIYAFVPWRLSQLSHLQFQWGGFLCLLLLFLLRYLDSGRRSDLVLFGVAFAWNALSNVHYALFSGLLVGLALGLFALEKGGAGRARLLAAAAAATAGGLTFLPFALAYRRAERLYGMRRYFSEMLFYSGRWSDFLSAGILNRLWGPVTRDWRGPEGDFFPGLAALGLAAAALVAVRRSPNAAVPAAKARGRFAVRLLDILLAVMAGLGVAAAARPGLRLGGISVGDPGRVLVWLTVLVVARLAVALPGRSAFADAGDWLRRSRVPPRLTLFAATGVVGVVVALGGHTPYYRFLFQSFGGVFRAVRSPARGIVLFHVALAVLAAWGFASVLRRRSPGARRAWTAVAVALVALEYRAFPLDLHPVEAAAPPVYRWLAEQRLPDAVVEWPLGTLYDFDYVFRQAQHGQSLVNGYSGFFPETYRRLQAALERRPIPGAVWAQMGELGGCLLVYHPHVREGVFVAAYADALDRAVSSGGLELARRFPHGDDWDFVLVPAGAAWAERLREDGDALAQTRAAFDARIARVRADGMRLAAPFGYLDAPSKNATVAPGEWGFGWALDDSGIAEVRAETEAGPVSVAGHLRREGLERLYPAYPESDRGGYAFRIPDLAPGIHRLRVTFVGRDGGTTSIERTFRVAARSLGGTETPAATAPAPRS
ncbi:MAG TPA: hypothetical protein VFA98_15330 [Thermoanaerobaculia bacterium]|nr:hypothetical protein [Thermoanaerobaculia bacterium]